MYIFSNVCAVFDIIIFLAVGSFLNLTLCIYKVDTSIYYIELIIIICFQSLTVEVQSTIFFTGITDTVLTVLGCEVEGVIIIFALYAGNFTSLLVAILIEVEEAMIFNDVLKTILHLTFFIECEILVTTYFNFLSHYINFTTAISRTCIISICCMIHFAIIDVVPVCIAVCLHSLGTIDLIPAISSPAFFIYIVVQHLTSSCYRAISTFCIKLRVGTNRNFLIVNPLIQHLTMLIEHVELTVDFLLCFIFVHFTRGLEPVPTFVITRIRRGIVTQTFFLSVI